MDSPRLFTPSYFSRGPRPIFSLEKPENRLQYTRLKFFVCSLAYASVNQLHLTCFRAEGSYSCIGWIVRSVTYYSTMYIVTILINLYSTTCVYRRTLHNI